MPCLTAEEEEEVQPGGGQLAVRPADMNFEQAMRHYMDEIARTARDTNSQLQTLDNRQDLHHSLLEEQEQHRVYLHASLLLVLVAK